MLTNRQAVLAAILYADIFDYPLTKKEAVMWSVGKNITMLSLYSGTATYRDFIFLKKRRLLIGKRLGKGQFARKKWAIADRAASVLKKIPTVELVGVTGGLAMENAEKDDDIDFFIIVRPGTMWITRLLCVLFIEALGMRRRWGQTKVKNLICLNMFLSASAIAIKEHDLYVAHEVLQMTPLWERAQTYKKFLMQNQWVKKFLPNAWKVKIASFHPGLEAGSMSGINKPLMNDKNIIVWILCVFEPVLKFIQKLYMENHRTTEVISDHLLQFHPNDARIWVKEALRKRCLAHHIPLDKVWNGQ